LTSAAAVVAAAAVTYQHGTDERNCRAFQKKQVCRYLFHDWLVYHTDEHVLSPAHKRTWFQLINL